MSEPATPPTSKGATAEAAEPQASTGAETKSSAAPPFSIAALGGWGLNAAAKLGFGARAGYTLPFHVYVGATFVYHLGESENGGTANFFYPGAEAGFELALGPLIVRPYVGGGPLVLHAAIPPTSISRMYFAIWPGATAAFAMTPSVFFGADVRYLFSSYAMLGVFGTVGARF